MQVNIKKPTYVGVEDFGLLVNNIQEEFRAAQLLKAVPSLQILRVICSHINQYTSDENDCIDVVARCLLGGPNEDSRFTGYLFFSHEICQPKTRMTRYNKLWKSFSPKYDLTPFVGIDEVEIEFDKGIRYVAIAKLDHSSFKTASQLLMKEKSAFIFFSPQANLSSINQARELFHLAFPLEDRAPNHSIDWINLILSLCPLQTQLLKAYGVAEEGEISFNLIGIESSIDTFYRRAAKCI